MTVYATTNIVPTSASGPTTRSESSVSVSITAQSGSSSTVISVSGTTNCSASTSSITVNPSLTSGTYSASFRNVYAYVFGTPVYATTTISGSIEAWVSPPTSVALTPATTTQATISVSAATSGGTSAGGEALQVSDNGSSWSSNGASFSGKTRGTSYTFYGRRVLNGVNSASTSQSYTVPYLATSTAGTISASPTNPAYTGSTSTITLSIGSKAAGHDYYVDGSGIGSATSVTKTLAAPAESTATYTLTVIRPTSYGGDGNSVADGSATATRGADESAPVISSVTNNNYAGTSVTATINLSSSGSGGDGLEYNNGSGWQSGASFSQNRNTTVSYTARRSGIDLASSSVDHAVGYISPTQSGSLKAATIAYTASTSYTIVFASNVDSTHDYRINSGTVNSAAVTVPATAGAHAFSLQTRRRRLQEETGQLGRAPLAPSILLEKQRKKTIQ